MDSDLTSPLADAPIDEVSRCILYALSGGHSAVDDYVFHALASLREHASRLVVIAPRGIDNAHRARLEAACDHVVVSQATRFAPVSYFEALDTLGGTLSDADEIVLTGDAWFGPVRDVAPVLQRMRQTDVDLWEIVSNPESLAEAFPEEGFPHVLNPWRWVAVTRPLFTSPQWAEYWQQPRSFEDALVQELHFVPHFRARGFVGGVAYSADDLGAADPALFRSEALLDAGHPFVDVSVFARYPPFLDRFAVIGREIVATMEEYGYPLELVWQHLARTVPLKALNTNGGMLEILPGGASAYDADKPFRIAVMAHVTDVDGIEDILRRVEYLPTLADVIVTTNDGLTAAKLEAVLEVWSERTGSVYELRVTPAGPGRDMSDFFVACRDVLLSGRYDLVAKLHSRHAWYKTLNRRRYFRRYQLDNLLDSPGYAENILSLFQKEPGLGMVFPPMMHIGYATMGRGWSYVREQAGRVASTLGISVPLDHVSPLAPYGGMWFARPAALRLMVDHKWAYRDYGPHGQKRYGSLSRIQERLVTYSAAELGYHSRTVLTFEHASISHTALDFKTDQMFSTTRGWPVEQIRFLHRAGYTGYGGTVALARMYMRVNHPRVVHSLRPVYRIAYRSFSIATPFIRVLNRLRTQRGGDER